MSSPMTSWVALERIKAMAQRIKEIGYAGGELLGLGKNIDDCCTWGLEHERERVPATTPAALEAPAIATMSVNEISRKIHAQWLNSGDRSYSPHNRPWHLLHPAARAQISRQSQGVLQYAVALGANIAIVDEYADVAEVGYARDDFIDPEKDRIEADRALGVFPEPFEPKPLKLTTDAPPAPVDNGQPFPLPAGVEVGTDAPPPAPAEPAPVDAPPPA